MQMLVIIALKCIIYPKIKHETNDLWGTRGGALLFSCLLTSWHDLGKLFFSEIKCNNYSCDSRIGKSSVPALLHPGFPVNRTNLGVWKSITPLQLSQEQHEHAGQGQTGRQRSTGYGYWAARALWNTENADRTRSVFKTAAGSKNATRCANCLNLNIRRKPIMYGFGNAVPLIWIRRLFIYYLL